MILALLGTAVAFYIIISVLVTALIFVRMNVPIDTWTKRGTVIAISFSWPLLLISAVVKFYRDFQKARKEKGF